jgi:hypothetical protein
MRSPLQTKSAAACASCLIAALALIAGCRRAQPPTSSTASPSTVTTSTATPGNAAADIQKIQSMLQNSSAAQSAATADAAAYAWDLFIYANWPARTNVRGEPDPSKTFGVSGPVVWQTWKTSQDTYVAPGLKPVPWDQGPVVEPPALQSDMIDGKVLTDKNGNPVTYEVRLNQDTFGYILSRKLYTSAGQMQLLQKGAQPVQFPDPSMEVKAAWRLLGANDDPTHYLTTTVQYQGAVRVLGLSGLHITSRALPQWVWTTFEQVENPQTTGVNLLLPIPGAVQTINQQMQSAFAGTRWAYYRLNGVQTAFLQNADAPPCPNNAKATCNANTQIETNFQLSSSCITCHSLASIGPGGKRHSFWNYKGGNQQGFVGKPPPLKSDVSLEFVWSMREAQ